MKEDIPIKTVYRLTLYSSCLEQLGKQAGPTISSEVLSKVAGVKATQLRKDLACCGPLGKRGLGYDVELLKNRLFDILHKTRLRPVVLVGAGNLGMALLRYNGFQREGFEIVAAFDAKPDLHHASSPVTVYPMRDLADFLTKQEVRMAILCVPATAGQDVCNQLVENGIEAILNFSPTVLQVPKQVAVNNVNLAIELESLGFFLR